LYGLNTLGAAGGAFLSGFVLVKAFGVLKTIYLAAASNMALAVGFAALALAWKATGPPGAQQPAEAAETPLGRGRLRLLLAAVAVSGATSLSYEVLWTRLLMFRFEATVYAFSIMLTTFLLGLGIGSVLVGLLRRRARPVNYWRVFGYLQAAVGLSGLATMVFMFVPRLPYQSFAGRALSHLGTSMTVVMVPTVLLGAAFPIACHLFAGGVARTGASVGRIYVFNTLGCVTGALLTGFWLTHALGTQWALTAGSLLMVASGSAIVAADPARPNGRRRITARGAQAAAIWAVAVAIWAAVPDDILRTYYLRSLALAFGSPQMKLSLLDCMEDAEGVVLTVETPNRDRVLSAGATPLAGTSFEHRVAQKSLAHVPMLMHSDPKDVCQVGFGSGETSSLLLTYKPDRLDCIEISPAVVASAARHFVDLNKGILEGSHIRPIVMDAAAYLKHTDRTYDVIANDSSWPHLMGSSGLYTLEYFRNGQARLKPGGIMTSWMPLEMPLVDFQTVLKTSRTAFPHVYAWTPLNPSNKHLLLIGCDRPLQIDLERFLERFDTYARDDLRIVHLDDPAAFLACHLASLDDAADELASVALNTEDLTVLQFLESRPEEFWPRRESRQVRQSLEFLSSHRESIVSHLTVPPGRDGSRDLTARVRRMDAAVGHFMRSIVASSGDPKAQWLETRAGVALAPTHPYSILVANERRELGRLPSERIRAQPLPGLGELAHQLYRVGLYDKALIALEERARREPASAEAHADVGACYLDLGQPERALGPLHKALQLNPQSVDARLNLGVSYVSVGRPAEAIPHLEQARKADSQSAGVLDALATAFAMTGQKQTALELFHQAIAANPDYSPAYYNLAVLQANDGNTTEAIAHLLKLLRLNPSSAEAHRFLAELYTEIGDEPAADRHQREAARLAAGSHAAAIGVPQAQ